MFDFIEKDNKCWSKEKAWEWYNNNPRVLGFNYVPAYAVNSTEMWQDDSFDIKAIDVEMAYAKKYGYNTVRVFMQFILWQENAKTFKANLSAFLDTIEKYGIKCVVILCDDCAFSNLEPYLGEQNAPTPLVHNSGWTPSPASMFARDINNYGIIKDYVLDVVGAFRNDSRILMWDLYNEPGNSKRGAKSLYLIDKLFEWARKAGATQPLTTDVWAVENGDATKDAYFNDAKALELSDIVTFHQYGNVENLIRIIKDLGKCGYPIICTEWMARMFFDSLIETHLDIFDEYDVGCIHWGLVNGKTQTHIPWGWDVTKGEPDIWFHDVLRSDGRPYNEKEMQILSEYSKKCIR